MPHMFVNRPRLINLTENQPDVHKQFLWETINAVFYKIGGIIFIIGSILFFPRFEKYADIAAWMFFVGSLFYLIVTGHDLVESMRYWRINHDHGRDQILSFFAAASYLLGTILFTAGSVFFVSTVGWFDAGAWCFVFGSLLFVAGACINVFQITKARSALTLQLMNLTAVSFIVGSVLFVVASVPYLWGVKAEPVRTTLYAFLAWQYLFGSLLFLIGGVFNYWLAYVTIRDEINKT
jgi:hypothetical protein